MHTLLHYNKFFKIIEPLFAENDDCTYVSPCRKWNCMAQWILSSFHPLMRAIVCRQMKLNCKLYWLQQQVPFEQIQREPLNCQKDLTLPDMVILGMGLSISQCWSLHKTKLGEIKTWSFCHIQPWYHWKVAGKVFGQDSPLEESGSALCGGGTGGFLHGRIWKGKVSHLNWLWNISQTQMSHSTLVRS